MAARVGATGEPLEVLIAEMPAPLRDRGVRNGDETTERGEG